MSWSQNSPHTLPDDRRAGIDVTEAFEPFAQRNDIFTRAFWDPQIRSTQTDAFFASYRIEAAPRRGDGFGQKDFALRNASWLISDLIANRGAAEGRREGFQAPMAADTPCAP
ncbi:MAG TPA: reductive dehalogenase, partial [Rhodobacteraceae bacterium]|nr:reductive dehalogenase [Paracoccaceae bacterium]